MDFEELKEILNFVFENRISIIKFTDEELFHFYKCIERELYFRNSKFLNPFQKFAYKKVTNALIKYYLTDGEATKERSDAGSP